MKNDEAGRGEMRIVSPGEGHMNAILRFVLTATILLVIVLATGAVLARTDGGRSLIEDRLGKKLAIEVSVARSRIALPYALVLEDVASKDFADGHAAGFRVEEVRLSASSVRRLNVRLRGVEAVLVRDEEENWLPECLSRLGDLPVLPIDECSRVTGAIRDRISLHARDGLIVWRNDQGHTMASADGVSFDMVPVRMPGRRMFHCKAVVDEVLRPDMKRMTKVRREWLAGDGLEYIEIERGDGADAVGWEADTAPAE